MRGNDRRSPPRKSRSTSQRYGRAGAANGWHFLTGDEHADRAARGERRLSLRLRRSDAAIRPSERDHGADAGAAKCRATFPGIEYPPRDVRLALIDASQNRVGSLSRPSFPALFSLQSAHRKIRAADHARDAVRRNRDSAALLGVLHRVACCDGNARPFALSHAMNRALARNLSRVRPRTSRRRSTIFIFALLALCGAVAFLILLVAALLLHSLSARLEGRSHAAESVGPLPIRDHLDGRSRF